MTLHSDSRGDSIKYYNIIAQRKSGLETLKPQVYKPSNLFTTNKRYRKL